MTTPDELVEKVTVALRYSDQSILTDYETFARTALRIALEEAARVVDKLAIEVAATGTYAWAEQEFVLGDATDAIRALIPVSE